MLRIKPDGSLVAGRRPVASDGATPVSIAVHGDLVYVANAGAGGSNYTGFTLDAGRPPARRSRARRSRCPTARSPATSCSAATARKLVGDARRARRFIDSFRVGADGRLTAAPGSPFAAQGLGPFGSEFRPTNPTPAVRLERPRRAGQRQRLGLRRRPATATLTSIGASPFADQQTAPCWVEISHDGQYLFAVNTAVATISRYSIAPDGALTLLGSTALKNPPAWRRSMRAWTRRAARCRSSTAAATRSARSRSTAAT